MSSVGAVDNTMGALLIGVLLAMGLWGASSVQVYYYFNAYPNDPTWIKGMVISVWIFDTIHQGLITNSIYDYLVTHYADPSYLAIVNPSLMIEVAFSSFVVLLVQSFFLLRIFKLSNSNWTYVIACSSVMTANFICAMIFTIRSQLIERTYTALGELSTVSRLVNVFSAVSDLFIAVSLIFLLQTSRTGFSQSENVINRLIMFSLNTGLLTSLDAIASFITFSALPNSLVYIMFYVTNCKLYTNSLMASLNTRKNASSGAFDENRSTGQDVSSDRGFRSRAVEVGAPSSRGFGTNHHALSIKVATETVHDIDGDDTKVAHEDTEVYHYGKN